jgi:hypothetical protein
MDHKLFYNCAATYSGIITIPLILKKKQKINILWLKIRLEDMIRKRPIEPYWITLCRYGVLHQVLENGWWLIFYGIKGVKFYCKTKYSFKKP